MAESDTGDKTEAPTPKRRAEAAEKGQVARSTDLTAAVLLLSTLMLLSWSGDRLLLAMRDVAERLLGGGGNGLRTGGEVLELIVEVAVRVGSAALPMACGLALAAVAVNVVQTGFSPSLKRIQPNLAALNPTKGLSRLFGKGKGVVGFGMGVAKMLLVAGVAYTAVHGRLDAIVTAAALEPVQIFDLAGTVVYDIALRIGVVLLVLAILDFAYQKWKHEQELKMSKQDVKEEMKRMEGDPLIKQRRRQLHHQRVMQKVRKDVPTADVIVTNPTHFAVALKYDGPTMNAPRVVAKGVDFLALRIREIAAEHGIPIIERPPLARAMYKSCEVGQEIPEQFYAAVAELLAYVYELTGRGRRRQSA